MGISLMQTLLAMCHPGIPGEQRDSTLGYLDQAAAEEGLW